MRETRLGVMAATCGLLIIFGWDLYFPFETLLLRHIRPRSPCSNTTMLWPSRRSSRAVTKPEAPAPITATWRDKIGWGACRDMEEILATGHRVNTVPAETENGYFVLLYIPELTGLYRPYREKNLILAGKRIPASK